MIYALANAAITAILGGVGFGALWLALDVALNARRERASRKRWNVVGPRTKRIGDRWRKSWMF